MTSEHEPNASPADPSAVLEALRRRGTGEGEERYEELGVVAQGGMGVILSVRDREMRRRIAMKVLRERGEPESDASSALDARFLEEAQLTSQLDHPGIVPVHELGLDANGRLYFTMRRVKGRTLHDVYRLVARAHADRVPARAAPGRRAAAARLASSRLRSAPSDDRVAASGHALLAELEPALE